MTPASQETDNRQRVLDAARIERVIGEHITLRPKGRELVCLCPFHTDRNPSMYVVPAKQIFHCFVCGAGGNAIDFVMKFHGMGFREALEFLAQQSGIELVLRARGSAPAPDPSASSRQDVLDANALAMRFFRGILAHPEHGAAARAVIERRGIAPEMVESFGLGAAPDRWDGLVRFAESKQIPARSLIDAGLIKPRQSGDGSFDMLRHRLVFPIFDQIGRPVAFGGRKIRDEDEPKYLNSPESKVFDKSATLFGLKQALRGIQETRTAIVTEGYTDVIACHQAGFTNVVATLGTAMTPKHAAVLRRLCDTLILLFDGDEAGQRAADRALEVFFAEPIDVKIAVMQGGKDPDELLKQPGGAEAFRGILAAATHFLDFRFARLRARLAERGLETGTAARAAAIDLEIDRLVELGLRSLSPLRQQAVIARLSSVAGVDTHVIVRSLSARGSGAMSGGAGGASTGALGRQGPARRTPFEQALGCLLCDEGLSLGHPALARDLLEMGAYCPDPLRGVAAAFSAIWAERGAPPDLHAMLLELEDPVVRSCASALAAEMRALTDEDPRRLSEHWRLCARRALADRGGTSPASPAPAPGTGLLSALEGARQEHARTGGKPMAMPRPRGAVIAARPTLGLVEPASVSERTT